MSTSLLITLQFLVLFAIATMMMAIIVLRQKKTIIKLKKILTDVKDDITGDRLIRHFQVEIDTTTAHCRQETIALNPDLEPEDLALSLRYLSLQAELILVQDHIGAVNTPWREQIKHYVNLATTLTDLIKSRIDNATKTLLDEHNKEIAEKNSNIEALNQTNQAHEQTLKELAPLRSFLEISSDSNLSRPDLEQSLHKALLSLCENFGNSENLRELVYLLHESFHESAAKGTLGHTSTPEIPESTHTSAKIDPNQNLELLNNIIEQQNKAIRNLRKQIAERDTGEDNISLLECIDALEETIQSSDSFAKGLSENMLEKPSNTDEGMSDVIDKFITESADMVEKIHLLTQQNKQLSQENEVLKQSLEISLTDDISQPTSDNLKSKLESQQQEFITLQKNFNDLESKYLELYQSNKKANLS